jgi:superfamily II DNA helicase RecQ
MQLRFFSIPASGDPVGEEELNQFLRSHRVLAVQREFVAQGSGSYWSLVVEFLEGSPASGAGRSSGARPDYKQLLAPQDFAVFLRLRQWRKLAAEEEGVPVYTIFTNEQLAEMARLRPTTKDALGSIAGVGTARLERYGETVLGMVRGDQASTEPRVPAGPDAPEREEDG